jgi:hypothetical protein
LAIPTNAVAITLVWQVLLDKRLPIVLMPVSVVPASAVTSVTHIATILWWHALSVTPLLRIERNACKNACITQTIRPLIMSQTPFPSTIVFNAAHGTAMSHYPSSVLLLRRLRLIATTLLLKELAFAEPLATTTVITSWMFAQAIWFNGAAEIHAWMLA